MKRFLALLLVLLLSSSFPGLASSFDGILENESYVLETEPDSITMEIEAPLPVEDELPLSADEVDTVANEDQASEKAKEIIAVPKKSASPTTLSITKKTTKKVYLGNSYQIKVPGKKVQSFKSSNKKVAKVSKSGRITLKKAGKAKVTINLKKKKIVLTLKVIDPCVPTKVTITEGKSGTLVIGTPFQLTAVVKPSTASQTVTWKSSKKAIATIDKNGLVTPHKVGTVRITATAGKKKATFTVHVEEPPKGGRIELYDYYHRFGEDVAKELNLTWKDQSTSYSKYAGTFTNEEIRIQCSGRRNMPGGVTFIALDYDKQNQYCLCGVNIGMSYEEAIETLNINGWSNEYVHRGLVTLEKDGDYISFWLDSDAAVSSLYLEGGAKTPIYRALLIGVETFSNTDGTDRIDERFSNDLTVIHGALTNVNGGDVIVTKCIDPESPSDVQNAIEKAFGSANNNDVSLVFISTHGQKPTAWKTESEKGPSEKAGIMTYENGDMTLAHNGNLKPIELATHLSGIKGIKVLFIGSCLSGGALLEGKNLTAFVAANCYVITAGKANEETSAPSYPWQEEVNAFANVFFDAIELEDEFPADNDPHDGTLTLHELYNYLKKNVPLKSLGQSVLNISHPQKSFVDNLQFPLFWKPSH